MFAFYKIKIKKVKITDVKYKNRAIYNPPIRKLIRLEHLFARGFRYQI